MAEACLTGFGANLATEFVKSIFGTIKQQIFYVFKHKSYINDLSDQVQELNRKRQRVELDVDHARRQGEEIYEDVSEWLKDVNRFIEQKANPITGKEDQVGTCSLIARYKAGRKAVKATKAGSSLLGKDCSRISYRPALQRTESMYVDRDYEAFDSRESLLLEIMEALKDASANRIGVYGMGGVGKTTLAKKVAWQANNLFDDVVMVEVTETPDYKKIQEKIAFDLGLEFKQHESEVERAGRIRNRLKKGKTVLVILDNIWAKPDLNLIGIPLGNEHEKGINAREKEARVGMKDDPRQYKILVTSRRQDILSNYMNTSKNFWVKTLSDKEAQNLLWKIVGNSVEKDSLGAVAEEIVGKCGGLPLAVATIANALKNKGLIDWENALDKLNASNPRVVPEMDKNVFSVIKLSFDLLDNPEAESLLMLFSLLDAGRNFPLDYLLRYGMGLGLFQDVYELEKGRTRLESLANDLKATCLLLEGGTKTSFKMHEVVHAVARSIASTDKLMFNIPNVPDLNRILHEKLSKNPMAISLPSRDIYELPERLECTKLEFFLLQTKSQFGIIPNNLFSGVKELKVIDLDHINLMSMPSSFRYLTNLRTLCLDECLLGDVSIIGELTNIEILSFSRSNIDRLPREIGQLMRLRLLDLSLCSLLTIIPANVFSRLSRLEELDLEESFVEWEDVLSDQDGCNANLAELNQLPHLTSLRVCILDAEIIPLDLFIPRLKRFQILIGDVWNWSCGIEASRTLKLKFSDISYLQHNLIKILLKTTDDLSLDELNDVQDILYQLDEEGFQNLKYLHVQNGPELLYIVNSAEQIPSHAFPALEALSLDNLANLVKICQGRLEKASFNKLKALKVNKCDKLKHLFSISMAKCLSQLHEIEVTDCKNLQGIFVEDDGKGHSHDESEANNKIEFTQLQSLTLKLLPQFKSFRFNMGTPLLSQTEIIAENDPENFKTLFGKRIEFPSLENLILSSINIEKISLMNTSCHTLKSLVVEDCNRLKFLFSSSMVKSLMQLQILKISKCELMEEVIDTKGLEGEGTISFPKLLELELEELPNLTRFGSGNLVEFPLMSFLEIFNCPNLRTFFSNSTCEITSNKPAEMNSEQYLQPLFGGKVGLPCLEVLNVYQMDNLRKMWGDQLSSDSFSKLTRLQVGLCNNLLYIFPSSMLGRLNALEELDVWRCDSLEKILEFQALNDQKTRAIMAPQLRNLYFSDLPELKHIWNMNARQILSFQNLIEIDIDYCNGLKSLFPATIANGLLKLENLKIGSCRMNEIVANEERVVEDAIIPRFKFPRLSSLKLSSILGLRTFYPEPHISEWPALRMMKVFECSSIKILSSELQRHQQGENILDHPQALFFVDKVKFPSLQELKVYDMDMLLHLWVGNSQTSRVFQNLETLEVSKCRNLKNLVPSTVPLYNLKTLKVSKCDELTNLVTLTTARSLGKVTTMDIADCRMIEEIITQEGDEAINDDDRIVFNQLNYLRLHGLPSLTSFCSQSYALEFPQLEQVIIGYTMMDMFCPGVLSTPKLHKVLSTEDDDDQGHWQDNLNTTTQLFFKELVGFSGIESLRLSEFPKLKEKWHNQLQFSVFCNLKLLEVDECTHLSTAISTDLLRPLSNLKDLYVRNCDSVEEVLDLEKLHDDGHLRVLSQLSKFHLINLPRLKCICRSHQEILDFQNLEFLEVQACDNLRYMFTLPMISSLKRLREMKISNCVRMEIIIINEAKKDAADEIVLPMLESIILESLPKLTSFYSGRNMVGCSSLRMKTINDCTKMEDKYLNFKTLFSKEVSVPHLEKLEVYKLDNLKKIWDDQKAWNSFSELKECRIENCSELKNIFPSIVLGRLQTLESLIVSNCESLEAVVVVGKERISEKLFPKLVWLKLEDLPKLKRFCNFTGDLIEFFSLSTLEIINCPNMETFVSNSMCTDMRRNEPEEIMNSEDNLYAVTQPLFDEKVSLPNLERLMVEHINNLRKIWDDDHFNLDSFSKLRDMRVKHCNGILHIFPPVMHGRLQRLQLLKVWNCDSLEEILQLLPLSERDEIVFKELNRLELVCLPRLTSFCLGNCTLKFPSLNKVFVGKCSKMETFSHAILSTPNLQRVQLTDGEFKEENEEEYEGRWERDLNTTIQHIFKEMNAQISGQD